MKILFVAPWIPSKLRPRSFGILKHLAAAHDVYFVGLGGASEREAEIRKLPLAGLDIIDAPKWAAKARAVRALATRKSLQASYVDAPEMRTAIREAIAEFKPDVAHFNVIRSAAYIAEIEGLPLIYDMDEVRSDYYQQHASSKRLTPLRFVGKIEAPRMARLERKVTNRASFILMSSPADLNFGFHGQTVLTRSPFDTPVQISIPSKNIEPRILFVGRMSFAPNAQAAEWFAEQVMPQILASHPNVVFDIVGERPSRTLRNLASRNIKVHGFVESLDNLYAEATLAVAPVTLGTGVQMKVIQSIGAGLPTVVTQQVADRAGLTAGTDVLVADDVHDWAKQISTLISRPDLRLQLREGAKRWIETHYADGTLYAELDRSYEQIKS